MRFIALTIILVLQILHVIAHMVNLENVRCLNVEEHTRAFRQAQEKFMFLDYDVSDGVDD